MDNENLDLPESALPVPIELNIHSLRTQLLDGRLQAVVGLAEGTRLEFKGAPYALSQGEHIHYELAKDVSAFANASGGLLVLGVATALNPDHRGEEASEIRPFTRSLIDTNQYQQILRSWIYPSLEGVEIQWLTDGVDPDRGLACIYVPEQAEKPYVLIKGFTPEGKKLGTLIGLYKRVRDVMEELKAPQLQTLLQNGLRFDQLIQQRFEGLEAQLKQLTMPPAPVAHAPSTTPSVPDLLASRVNDAIRDVGLAEASTYLLAACPAEPSQLRGLVESSHSDLIRLLEQPPKLRDAGFNLDTGTSTQLLKGQLRRVIADGRQLIELWRDGTAIFITLGDGDFLCWGRPPEPGIRVINSVALIESTFNFAVLLKVAYATATPPPEHIQLHLSLRRLLAGVDRCVLLPMKWSSDPIGWTRAKMMNFVHNAPSDDYAVTLTLPWNLEAGVLAYRLLQEVYLWFGIPHDQIPFTSRIGDELGISHEAIRMIGR